MKKAVITLFLIVTVMSACSSSNSQPIDNNQAGNNENVATEIVALPTMVEPTAIIEVVEESTAMVTCTAVSEEKVELVQEGDWITGAVEGYAVTLIEYGDYQ